MKNLNDIAVDYRGFLLNRIEDFENQITDLDKYGFMQEEDKQDLRDQMGHAEATIEMIDKILKKSKPKTEIIIEIKGGLIQATYSNVTHNELDLYVVDWDNIGCDRESLDYLPEHGNPAWIDRENWDIKHLLKFWKAEQEKKLSYYEERENG